MWDYKVVKEIALAGQPDAVSISPNGKFAAIAIENERDEDLNDGLIPQYPAGNVAIVNLEGEVVYADLRDLAEIAPSDPEPEFVDINDNGEIVVSLQENNHMVVLDSSGDVLSHFFAGKVDLYDIDDTKDGYYMPVGSRQGVRREPDAVAWIDADHFVTANEGDYKLKRRGEHKRGGSRGFTIFHKDGTIVYDSGNTFENTLAKAGYWNDSRAEKKGVEPESVAVGTYNGKRMLFVGAERANAVGVYDISNLSSPVMTQILPTGKAPEGLLTLEEEGLFITSNEKDPVNSISIFKF
jgi:alkaline phosphatase